MAFPPLDPPTAEPQALHEIRDWHRGMVEALVDQRALILSAIRAGSTVATRFLGMTEAEVDAYYDVQRAELDRLTMLSFVASAEAEVRNDYARRVRDKGSRRLSKDYQAWHKALPLRKQLRPDFDEGGILDVLKESRVMDNHIVGQFRECLDPRHWLAHGRYWDRPPIMDQLSPDDVYERAIALLRALSAA